VLRAVRAVHLKEGHWDEQREAFGDTVIDTIAEYAPNIKDIILHRQVLTPLDIEREFGLTEGNIFQGELTLEQLFFLRPAPGWAQYRTPIEEPLHVRLGDASRRRHHGRARPDRWRLRISSASGSRRSCCARRLRRVEFTERLLVHGPREQVSGCCGRRRWTAARSAVSVGKRWNDDAGAGAGGCGESFRR
jgi:hypothetical protein